MSRYGFGHSLNTSWAFLTNDYCQMVFIFATTVVSIKDGPIILKKVNLKLKVKHLRNPDYS